MKKILVVLSVCFLFSRSVCISGSNVKKHLKEGNAYYQKEEYDQAIENYQEALIEEPDSDIVNYDAGTGFYKRENYPLAIEHFEKALVSEDKSLEQKANYNSGNAKYKYGLQLENKEIEKAIHLLEESLRNYERALEIDPNDEDAKYNYEFVKKELQRLKEKQKKQKQNQQDKDQNKQDKEENKDEKQQKDENSKQDQPKEKNQPPETQEPKQQSKTEEQNPSPFEMTEEEAKQLLENYDKEQQPRHLYKQKLPKTGLNEVWNDW